MMKKKVRANIRQAARIVIRRYYLEQHGVELSRDKINELVRKTERATTQKIMHELKPHILQHDDRRQIS